jgi:hypothetical protein
MKVETTYQIATGGEEPSAETVLSINRAAQAIGMDDPVGLALMTVLRAQNDRIDQIPERIKHAAKELETSSRSKVDAVLAQAVAAAIPALTKEVVATADKIAGHKAETLKAKWFIAVIVICLVSIFSAAAGGYFYATGQIESASEVGYSQGYTKGQSEGYRNAKAVDEFTKSPTGRLALSMLFTKQLDSIVRCSQTGWTISTHKGEKWCITEPGVSGWILPDGYDKEDR